MTEAHGGDAAWSLAEILDERQHLLEIALWIFGSATTADPCTAVMPAAATCSTWRRDGTDVGDVRGRLRHVSASIREVAHAGDRVSCRVRGHQPSTAQPSLARQRY
jgi:hypothetical protein